MRTLVIAAFLLASAAIAQAEEESDVIALPARAAPVATAPIDDRAEWCGQYTAWLIAMTDKPAAPAADARTTHRLEVEMNSCTIDPQGYERETRVEAQRALETANG